ncbi:MAG: prepilin-type N-terminal cleavage/methylation domain-containing protein [Clostridiales bacterium]|nr:prepilin-type N-terminal cleavage/methylation domain-containing protein [Clostridiales bacterium]
MLKKISNNQGVTLIELILVVALMSLIFAAVFSVYLAGQRTFIMTSNQASVQQEIRKVSSLIVEELEFAHSWEISGTIPTSFDSNYSYIYVENQVLHIRLRGELSTFSDVEYELSFLKAHEHVLRIRLDGTKDSNEFRFETEIRKLNEGIFNDIGGIGDKISIRFYTNNL